MSANPSNSIAMYRGDVKTIVFTLTITEGGVSRPLTPSELAGVVMRFTAKYKFGDSDAQALIALASNGLNPGVVIDANASTATVTIPAASTVNVANLGANLVYDLQLVDADGNPHTFIVSTLAINADVTR